METAKFILALQAHIAGLLWNLEGTMYNPLYLNFVQCTSLIVIILAAHYSSAFPIIAFWPFGFQLFINLHLSLRSNKEQSNYYCTENKAISGEDEKAFCFQIIQ